MGYQESWVRIEPQRKFKRMIQAYWIDSYSVLYDNGRGHVHQATPGQQTG